MAARHALCVWKTVRASSALLIVEEMEAPMPRYYFDMRDGDGVISDEEGMELATMKAVSRKLLRLLPTWRETRSGNTPTAP